MPGLKKLKVAGKKKKRNNTRIEKELCFEFTGFQMMLQSTWALYGSFFFMKTWKLYACCDKNKLHFMQQKCYSKKRTVLRLLKFSLPIENDSSSLSCCSISGTIDQKSYTEPQDAV